MAKTLVALYDTCTDAEHGAKLMKDGFTRSEVHLALDHTEGCETPRSRRWGSASEGIPFLIRSSTSVYLAGRRAYAEESAEAVHSWWLRVAMIGLSRAWRSWNACTRSTSTSGRRSGGKEGWTGSDATARTSPAASRTATTTRVADRGSEHTAHRGAR